MKRTLLTTLLTLFAAAAFAQKGIAVRGLSLRKERVMRISVGLPEENQQVEMALGEIFG